MSAETRYLQKILRGELAALDGYELTLRHLDSDGRFATPIRGILDDHRKAVGVLRRHVSSLEGEPEQKPGPWGAFARALERGSAALSDYALLEVMKEGENHGLSEYRSVLASGGLPPDAATDIRDRLIPAQERHIALLDEITADEAVAGAD